jgi:DNA-directed RNA polymerase subunit RPC12/RpoP
MTAMTLDGHGGTSVSIDVCTACQGFWFDTHESLQLAPASTLRLFSLIGEQTQARKTSLASVMHCPRCSSRLLATNDLQRNTPFQYWRCDAGHGRFIGFFDFLREKDFIRPLTPAQLQELRNNVQFVNCSNCGGSVDVAKGTTCPHCGSPLSVLDMKQAEVVVHQLQRAAEPRPIDPALPLELARARREVDAAFGPASASPQWWNDVSAAGIVEAGVNAVLRWLKPSN